MRLLRSSFLALVATFLVGQSAFAEGPVTLLPDQMRNAAAIALEAGDAERAYTFSEALVKRDSTDWRAHLIHSRAARDLGIFHDAKSSARQAWALAENPEQKYENEKRNFFFSLYSHALF